jgi:hypothetical protein
VLGQFLANQIAQGAMLTCTSVSTTATSTTCSGMKLDGVDVRLAPTEANTICGAITGKGYVTGSGAGVVGSYLAWSGTQWSLGSGSASPMQNLTCNR